MPCSVQNVSAPALPMTKSAVESASASVPSLFITETLARSVCAGYPVAGSRI